MLIIDIPSKIDVDNSVDNSRSYPHFPLKDVEKRLIHSLSTGFQQTLVDNQCSCSVRTESFGFVKQLFLKHRFLKSLIFIIISSLVHL